MFGRHLPRACLCLVVVTGVAVSPSPARSQDRSTQERLDRVERDLNMLQRQVYRGAPPPMMGPEPGAAMNVEIRMTHLEEQMREVTGRVEEFMNQIDQLRRRVEQISSDAGSRIAQGGAAAGPLASAVPPSGRVAAPPPRNGLPFPPPPGSDDEDLPPRGPGGGPAALTPPGGPAMGGPTPIFGMLTPPGSAPASPPPPSRDQLASAGSRPPANGASPGGSPTEQYNRAFGLLKQADYPAAETALKAFVEQHPKDPMAGSAQYWLGETYYARSKYMEAAAAFAEGYKRYPKSAKAADDLLKLGMSLGRANQKQSACVALGQLDHDFPNPGASVKERAAAEKKRLGC